MVDDEEEMLYGDSNADATPSKDDLSRSLGQPTFSDGSSGKAEPSHWCMIIRENGVMEVRASTHGAATINQLHLLQFLFSSFSFSSEQIYQLPEWRLVFLVKNFPVGQRVLVDSSSGQSATQGDGKKEEVTRQGEIPLVKEVALVSLGYNRSRPYLLVRSSTHTTH